MKYPMTPAASEPDKTGREAGKAPYRPNLLLSMISLYAKISETPINSGFLLSTSLRLHAPHRWFIARNPQGMRISGGFSDNTLGLPKRYRAAPKMVQQVDNLLEPR
jgi:hypothetical protein